MDSAKHVAEPQRLRFHLLGDAGAVQTALVKNPDATIGSVSSKVAARLGIAGTFESLRKNGEAIAPDTRLADLPEPDVYLASDLTPAV